MSRYIDIEPIEKQIEFELTIGQCKTFSEREKGVLNIYDAIKNAPTADIEEVVRCKDCLFMVYQFGIGDNILCCRRSGLNMVDGNGYCAWGAKNGR